MRFNEDLATRPAWLPPSGTGARLSVLSWWAACDAGAEVEGFARCVGSGACAKGH